jgi:signal transduction histidine kinase
MEDRVAALIELATSYKAFLVNASSGSNAADMAFATHSEAELERAAQRSARTKVDVLAAMSHELRTPLNAIIGLAEMSAEERVGALDPRYRSYFEDIRNAGQHLLSIINQIYDAIRIDTDQMRIELAPANVAELVSSARALIAHAASSRGVHIDDVATDSRERVLCDAVRTRQVLVNLLNNAVKFTKPGGRVGIDVASANDREIDITVWDTGIGIPKDKQKQVFDSYFRVSDGAKTTDGIGLGLWISRNLADRMGGSLRLTSEVGLGTRITLRLKRAPLPKT